MARVRSSVYSKQVSGTHMARVSTAARRSTAPSVEPMMMALLKSVLSACVEFSTG